MSDVWSKETLLFTVWSVVVIVKACHHLYINIINITSLEQTVGYSQACVDVRVLINCLLFLYSELEKFVISVKRYCFLHIVCACVEKKSIICTTIIICMYRGF